MKNIEKQFEKHVLTTVLNTDNIKVFDFKREDGNINMYQRWIIDHGTLIVLGDCHNAIYKWNEKSVSLEFLASCDLGYFSSKCLADKDGYDQKVYDADEACIILKNIASERILSNYDDFTDTEFQNLNDDERFELVKHIIKDELNIRDVVSLFYHDTIQSAYDFLSESDNEFMFGCDGWEYGHELMQLTNIPKWHLSALRVANKKHPNTF